MLNSQKGFLNTMGDNSAARGGELFLEHMN